MLTGKKWRYGGPEIVIFWQVGDQELLPGVHIVGKLLAAYTRVASNGPALVLVVGKFERTPADSELNIPDYIMYLRFCKYFCRKPASDTLLDFLTHLL